MDSRGAFAGVKVVAVARVISGPHAAYQLALHGADVINVEPPGLGDTVRYAGDRSAKLAQMAMAPSFAAQNANKRSLTLNLGSVEGREILAKLIADADVLIENMRTGGMSRLGFGYADLKDSHPRLIYCSLTGYGQTGPLKGDAAMDMSIQAASGMMSVTGTPESGPLKTSYPAVDYTAGLAAFGAIASALYQRERTGRGQHIDVSMLESALMLLSNLAVGAINEGTVHTLVGNRSGLGGYVHNAYKCKEGVLLLSAQNDVRRAKLWKALGMERIYEDPRFATDPLRQKNIDALDREIEERLSARTAQEWEILLQRADIPANYIRSLPEIVQHPQVVERGFFYRFKADENLREDLTVPTAPYRLSESPMELRSPPPNVGQHTGEILRSLGYSDARIARLKTDGIV